MGENERENVTILDLVIIKTYLYMYACYNSTNYLIIGYIIPTSDYIFFIELQFQY